MHPLLNPIILSVRGVNGALIAIERSESAFVARSEDAVNASPPCPVVFRYLSRSIKTQRRRRHAHQSRREDMQAEAEYRQKLYIGDRRILIQSLQLCTGAETRALLDHPPQRIGA
jgi:hypothetical protein